MCKLLTYGLVFLLTGCSVVFGSRTQPIAVESKPGDAYIFVDDENTGLKTPNYVFLKKGKSHTVELKKEGYYDASNIMYNTFRRTDVNKLCKIDFYFGWLLLAIPTMITKNFDTTCMAFHKNRVYIELVPIYSIEGVN